MWFLGRQQRAGEATLNANGNITSSVGADGNGGTNANAGSGVGTHTVLPGGTGQNAGNGGYTTGAAGGTINGGSYTVLAGGTGGTAASGSGTAVGSTGAGNTTQVTYDPNANGSTASNPAPDTTLPPNTTQPFYTVDEGSTGSSTYTTYSTGGNQPIGAVWIPGNGNPFNPTGVNSVGGANPTGNGGILNPLPTSIGNNGESGEGIGAALAIIGAGAAACAIGLLGGGSGALLSGALAPIAVTVNAPVQNLKDGNDLVRDNFLNCIARTLGRTIVEQITRSTVNWINSGFQGKPTFIQNYKQFFNNVADQAAGAFIQGSALSFLCSPFSAQVKIAVAKSYANQSASPSSCSLSKVTNNVNNFMNGQFSAGGWKSMVSFNSVPTNNPYGAYAYGQIGINNAVLNAKQDAQRNISPQGFLNIQQAYDCKTASDNGTVRTSVTTSPVGTSDGNCKYKVTTPGSIIADSASKTLGSGVDQLNLAKNFDEIISALMRQLLTKALYGGLSNLSGQGGLADPTLSPQQQQAATLAQNILASLQNTVSVNQQYGYTEQGVISDLQAVQSTLQTTANCWISASTATDSGLNSQQQAAATTNASSTTAEIALLQTKVDLHNNNINAANRSIATLEQLESRILNAASLEDVQGVENDYSRLQSDGGLFVQTDIVTAQQNRSALQSQLSAISQTAATQLSQCYAIGIPKTI